MIRKSFDVFCDNCGWWEHGVVVSDGNGAELARAAVRAKGWRRLQVDGARQDLCPRCAAPHLTDAQRNNDANAQAAEQLIADIAEVPQPRLAHDGGLS